MSEQITVNIKSSVDAKYEIKVSLSATIAELKDLIAAASDVPASAQRLIYSGRVLKDTETVESYKIKDGNTVHLVKSAAARAAASTSSATTASTPSTTPGSSTNTASQVPSNIAAGQGAFNPLADLTGARYAGYAQLPSESMFGPDGGMQLPNPEDVERMMDNPMVQQSMSEMLRNPQMVDYLIQQSPQLRAMGPRAREILQSDMFRNMMTNPQMFRQMRQMQSMFGGGMDGFGGASTSNAFPAPGSVSEDDSNAASTPSTNADTAGTTGSTTGAAPANPFAAMFPGGAPPMNPFAMFTPPSGNSGSTGSTPQYPSFDPGMMQAMMQSLGGGQPAAAQPEDNRPPEERYEQQLRQLNDMGFMDFESNVRALRRSGGSVQGAVENLLNNF